MNEETKARRRELLRMQTEIEQQQCADCPVAPGREGNTRTCLNCVHGKVLLGIGKQLDRTIKDSRAGTREPAVALMTKEMIIAARKNGISEMTLSKRIYTLKWPAQRAVSEPVKSFKRKEKQA